MSANDRERVRFTATAAGWNDTTTVNSYHPLEVDRVRGMLDGQLAGLLACLLACLRTSVLKWQAISCRPHAGAAAYVGSNFLFSIFSSLMCVCVYVMSFIPARSMPSPRGRAQRLMVKSTSDNFQRWISWLVHR